MLNKKFRLIKKKILIIILSITILLAISFCFYVIFIFFHTDSKFQVALVASLTSFYSALYIQKKIKEREIESRLYEKKADIYCRFFDTFSDVITADKRGVEVDDNDLLLKLLDIRKQLLIWGSDKSIEIFDSISDSSNNSQNDLKKTFGTYENFYRIVRNDLGHKDKFKHKFALTRCYLNESGKKDLDK